MKKKLLPFIIFISLSFSVNAAHITGGEMIYEFLGQGTASNTSRFKITLKLFRDNFCTNCAGMPNLVSIGIFQGSSVYNYYSVPITTHFEVPVDSYPPCVQNPPLLSYEVALFTFEVDLPNNQEGYTVAYQTCCRVNPLQNVFNTFSGNGTGSTYMVTIPGMTNVSGNKNSSPQFNSGISLICYGKEFTLSFAATDPDGDLLVYSFCDAFAGGLTSNANNVNPLPPPYDAVPYINGYSSNSPLGNQAVINSQTGIISGFAPPVGKYVVSVCVNEFRSGVLIGIHKKDFIVNVADCDFAGATLEPDYYVCKDFTTSFYNLNPSTQNNSFNWDFGITSINSDTSNIPRPVFTFPDTGIYKVKLVVNRGQACTDSATTNVHVYPGFFPAFTSTGICANFPVQFSDQTKTTYGFVNSWYWNFGDASTITDTSRQQNPDYIYSLNGDKQVQLIVTNSKGCRDTAISIISVIDKPLIDLSFRDTLICSIDDLQLQATGIGNFTWAPSGNIQQANTATPVVSPSVTTTYVVTLDDKGCKNQDSVLVRVVDKVSLTMNKDTTICLTDPVLLGASTDGLRFTWEPSLGVSNVNELNTIANPAATTAYQLTSYIGKCSTTGTMNVTAIPYPTANAGNDTAVCFRTPAILNGSIIGSDFNWTPAISLANAHSLHPVAFPVQTTEYVLTVTDNRGCPKPGIDSVLVTVMPQINAFAGNDTSVVSGQPLQLQASGGLHYSWHPADYLNSNSISDPVANFPSEIDLARYMVIASSGDGCVDSAYINIKIFKTAPSVFVPSAFSPNGDGLNDILRPVTAGIKNIEYFRIYNRYGQMVFSSNTMYNGWDGTIGGRTQGTNSYVWIVKAIDYMDRPYFQKGLLTLIR